MATLTFLGATALRPARGLLGVGGAVGRRAQQVLSEPAERALLASLDTALSAADAALNSSVAADAMARILASPLIDDLVDRLVARALESQDVERLVGTVIDSPVVDVLARTVVTVAPPEAETASSATGRYSEPRRYVDLARRGGGSQ